MRLTENVYLVGGGRYGFGISHELDCHVYLINAGEEMALIDAGAGVTLAPILRNMQFDGLDPNRLKYILLTHAHADHAGACFEWRRQFGVEVAASPEAAQYLGQGDEERVSLAVAKRGGFYPPDYVFRACEVPHVISEGQSVAIGDLTVTAIGTPGHCSGMLSFILKETGRSILFSGDTVFHGGKILMTNVWDCNLQHYVNSIQKLSALDVDALLPGHMTIALQDGSRHIRAAWDTFQKLLIPASII